MSDPGGQYTALADGGLYPWNGPITEINTSGILSRVNLILIQAKAGHSFNDGGVFKWSDDQAAGVTIKIRDIRVNALAEGDNMTAGQLVKDIAARRGLPEEYIDGGGWNILPYKIEQGKVAEAWEYASMISNRRARTGDSGCRPTFEFHRYDENIWTVDDERQELTPIALDQFDRVRVRYQLHAASTSAKINAQPSPLPYPNEYETIGGKMWYFTSELPVAVAHRVDATMHLETPTDRREVFHLDDEPWCVWHEKNRSYWSILTVFKDHTQVTEIHHVG